ncbi:DNA-binding GntR family transcriptional regulator [Nitrobacteraceae bacterium AZCC 1564]
MDVELKAIDHESLSRTVYLALCDAITKGQFRSGDRLKIRDIAAQLGTSVTPVRDAILRLAHDDAVVFRSARDIRIPHLSKARYLEIRAIRLKLEGLAAENAARLVTDEDIADLEAIVKSNEEAFVRGDFIRGAELNQAFHFRVMQIARMPVLSGVIERIWLQMGPVIADAYIDGGRSMIEHHYPVIEALKRKDPDAAAAAIMNDLIKGGQAVYDRVSTLDRDSESDAATK